MNGRRCPQCGKFKSYYAKLCDNCAKQEENNKKEDHCCPRCGGFKSSYFPVCDRCMILKGTQYDDNIDNRYCPKCGKFKFAYLPLCNQCQYEQLIGSNEYEEISKTNPQTYTTRQIRSGMPGQNSKLNIKVDQTFHQKYDSKNTYECKCGIYVKSKGERTVADFLYKNNIPFEYEPESQYLEYNVNADYQKTKSIHPDFFIKGPVYFKNKRIENVYLEYWGMNTPEYEETKAYKIKLYKHHICTLINLYPEDLDEGEIRLTEKLTQFKDRQINF